MKPSECLLLISLASHQATYRGQGKIQSPASTALGGVAEGDKVAVSVAELDGVPVGEMVLVGLVVVEAVAEGVADGVPLCVVVRVAVGRQRPWP